METFYALVLQSCDLAIYAWPVSLALAAAALFALFIGTPLRDPQFRKKLWFVAVPYTLPLVVLIVGAALSYDGPPHPNWVKPPEWRGNVLSGIFLFHALAVIFLVAYLRGMRVRAAALVLPSLWLTLSCGFVAGIAIAGVGP